MGSGPAQDGTQLQAGELPAPALPHEDERRTELVADVEAAVLVLVYSLGALAAHYHSRVPVGAHPHLVQPERLVPEAPCIVAGEPLSSGQREAARPYADEVVGQNLSQRESVAPQLCRCPLFRQLLDSFALVLHRTSSDVLVRFYRGVYECAAAPGSEVSRRFYVTNVIAGFGRVALFQTPR